MLFCFKMFYLKFITKFELFDIKFLCFRDYVKNDEVIQFFFAEKCTNYTKILNKYHFATKK